MTRTNGNEIVCNLDKNAVYKIEKSDMLIAIPMETNKRIAEYKYQYFEFEYIPKEISAEFYTFKFDELQQKYYITNKKIKYPLNEITDIFINHIYPIN